MSLKDCIQTKDGKITFYLAFLDLHGDCPACHQALKDIEQAINKQWPFVVDFIHGPTTKKHKHLDFRLLGKA